MYFFFFQAEDGIRDGTVTGVQTCALPILEKRAGLMQLCRTDPPAKLLRSPLAEVKASDGVKFIAANGSRSEERRVGKSVDLGGRRIIKKKNERREQK